MTRTKTSKRTSRKGKAQKTQGNEMVTRMKRGLDTHAREWLHLLSDPCNAPLTAGCYAGLGSGMLYRTRTIVNPGASATDAYCYFYPSNFAGNGYYPLQWCSVNVSGTGPTNAYGATINGISGGTQMRCVAACLKLRYKGSELNRAGIVASHLTNDPTPVAGVPAGTAGSYYSAESVATTAQTTYRLGETQHEVRWAPTQEDGAFREIGGPLSPTSRGNAVGLIAYGYPAGTVVFELTAVWEIVPEAASGFVSPLIAPRSANTVNDVLKTIGDIGRWATDPSTYKPWATIANTAVGVGRALVRAAPSVAMLTL